MRPIGRQAQQWKRRSGREKGVAVIMVTLAVGFFLPMVGLAIDTGVLYVVRAKLQAAVDAGALAGARSLSRGIDLASQEANARSTAETYFHANFPDYLWDSRNIQVTTSIVETAYRTRSVTLDATTDVPIYFMHVLGVDTVTVRSSGTASRRDVNVMMVLDRSGSLETAGACGALKSAALSFVDKFAAGRDRLGMITFGAGARVDYSPNFNFKSGGSNPQTMIPQLVCSGWTASAQALWQGYQQLASLNEVGALNVILFFTDGQPNTITGRFPVITSGSSKSHCYDYDHGKRYTQSGWNPGPKLGNLAPGQGLYEMTAPAIPVSSDPIMSQSQECYFASGVSKVSQDIQYADDDVRYKAGEGNRDYFGNDLNGYKSISKASGRVKLSTTNMENVGVNALDSAGSRIRADTSNAVVVYTVGLGGAGAAEHTLLQRVSNDLSSPIHNANAPTGLYVFAPTAAQLNDAFSRIASEILRLSH